MGFLDVEIPDWLKPHSPADQAKARSQAMQTGLQIGAQAYQNQLQREHSWDMEKMRLAQGMDQFQQRLTLDKEKFAVDKQLDDLKIGMVRQDLQSQPKIIEYVNRLGRLTSPEEIESTPVPDGLGAQGIQIIQNAKRDAMSNALRLKAVSTEQQLVNHYLGFADNLSRRGHTALAAEVLGIIGDGTKAITPDKSERLKAIANTVQADEFEQKRQLLQQEWDARMDIARLREENKSQGPVYELSAEDRSAYNEAIKGKTFDEINDIRESFGLRRIEKSKIGSSATSTDVESTGLIKTVKEWIYRNPELAQQLSAISAVNPIAGGSLAIWDALTTSAKFLKEKQKKEAPSTTFDSQGYPQPYKPPQTTPSPQSTNDVILDFDMKSKKTVPPK